MSRTSIDRSIRRLRVQKERKSAYGIEVRRKKKLGRMTTHLEPSSVSAWRYGAHFDRCQFVPVWEAQQKGFCSWISTCAPSFLVVHTNFFFLPFISVTGINPLCYSGGTAEKPCVISDGRDQMCTFPIARMEAHGSTGLGL